MAALPRLDVMMMIAFLKDTVRPWLSVTRPSSSTCAARRTILLMFHMDLLRSSFSKTATGIGRGALQPPSSAAAATLGRSRG